jgi:hypothetical protein
MAKLRRTPISLTAFEAIREHNEDLIRGLQGSLDQYRGIPKANRPAFVEGQIKYWRSAIAALKWSTKLAAQRAGIKHVKR